MFNLFTKKPETLKFKQVKLFGKLPRFADFVRFRSADPEAVLWDNWFTQGLSQAMSQKNAGCLTEYWSLNTCREINGVFHLASLLSSHDRSGRQFPIVLITEVHNDWLKDYKPSLPVLFEALDDFGRSFHLSQIETHSSISSAIDYIESETTPLIKAEVLDGRLRSLKKLKQKQAWGRWADQYPELNRVAWKTQFIKSLKEGKEWEIPLGSDQVADEAVYWLQLIDDLRALKSYNLSYYCLYSETVKKLIVRLDNPSLPDFQALFNETQTSRYEDSQQEQEYQEDLDLLAGLNYWKKVVDDAVG